jgi:hypothetical protein
MAKLELKSIGFFWLIFEDVVLNDIIYGKCSRESVIEQQNLRNRVIFSFINCYHR